MVFNSLQFLVFFGIVTSAYFLLAHKYRWALLLAASCYFYMAFVPVYLGILGLTIVIDYFAGIYLERFQGGAKKIFLGCSLLANLGVLAIFKYYFFFTDNFNFLASYFSIPIHFPVLNILLPIGLSFHTFQAMSYTIEVYRGKQKAERNFGIYSLYVMFYPQLVAGPIERPQNLIHQFYEKHVWDSDRVKLGLLQMMQGFFKKVVIADRLAMVVDPAYANLSNQSSLNLIIASIFYSFQIYCDFSGYSDIALGTARLFGIELLRNFAFPYFSRDIAEFWRRWHISLSSWFRDYLYIPLGGSKASLWKKIRNTFIIFLVSGFWHGANWTFIVWGLVNALYFMPLLIRQSNRNNLEMVAQGKTLPNIRECFQMLVTFLLTMLAWIFFRSESLTQAFHIIGAIFSTSVFFKPIETPLFLYVLILFFFVVEWTGRSHRFAIEYLWENKPRLFRWSFYYVLMIMMFLYGGKHEQFIYFQF